MCPQCLQDARKMGGPLAIKPSALFVSHLSPRQRGQASPPGNLEFSQCVICWCSASMRAIGSTLFQRNPERKKTWSNISQVFDGVPVAQPASIVKSDADMSERRGRNPASTSSVALISRCHRVDGPVHRGWILIMASSQPVHLKRLRLFWSWFPLPPV